jgi:hypothetical protein
MKKVILLIPTVLVTAFLALSFLLPGTAAGVIRAVVPSLQALPGGIIAVAPDGTGPAAAPAAQAGAPAQRAEQANSGSPPSPKAPPVTSNAQGNVDHGGHAVATGGNVNCDRMGNGHHSGKHDFVCPNQPYPQPVITHS